MSEALVYCSDDRDSIAQLKRHYRLKSLILYENGLYGDQPHLPLHRQNVLLIALRGRGGTESPPIDCNAPVAYIAELSAMILGAYAAGTQRALVVSIVASPIVDACATQDSSAASEWAIATRICIDWYARQQNTYYFDLIDIPHSFSLCDVHIALPPHARDDATQAVPEASDVSDASASQRVRIAPLYAPLYRLLVRYLSPHQVLTAIKASHAPSSILALCTLAEKYLALQTNATSAHSSDAHRRIIEHCVTQHNISQYQISELRNCLQRHPHLNEQTVDTLLRCPSYTDVASILR